MYSVRLTIIVLRNLILFTVIYVSYFSQYFNIFVNFLCDPSDFSNLEISTFLNALCKFYNIMISSSISITNSFSLLETRHVYRIEGIGFYGLFFNIFYLYYRCRCQLLFRSRSYRYVSENVVGNHNLQ